MIKRLIAFIVFFLIFEGFFFTALFKYFKVNKYVFLTVLILTLVSYTFFLINIYNYDRSRSPSPSMYWSFGGFLLFFVPKLISIFFWLFSILLLHMPMSFLTSTKATNSRLKFIGSLGLIVSSIPFMGIIYGMFKGKYNYKVIRKELYFSDLPKAFDEFKILQISDIHSGSLESYEQVKRAIDMINEQDYDLFLFTGDLVNNKASEMSPWKALFREIKTPKYGKYAVLGNHDYGAYINWSTEEEKFQNFVDVKRTYADIGFNLLLNENLKITRENQHIHLLGVENWGVNFAQYGDLNKATQGVPSRDFKVLMSHDPSHWEHEVKVHSSNVQLTLSGHTHGLQFGIEIPGWVKWSPVKYIYKQWAGLYTEQKRSIYVNRGFGYHGFPGRVGIWPEITVLDLRRG